MALSRKADYALRAMVELAANKDNVVSTRQLANKTQVPYSFMTKIINELALKGFIKVSRGNVGGVKMLADPKKITSLQIIEAISGPFSLNTCVLDPKSCPRNTFCSMHQMLKKAQAELAKTLSVDLESLALAQNGTV